MSYESYYEQVNLLLTVLPEINKERCFAIHGGTAINFLYRDMPRLSVDIDLTYIPIQDRQTTHFEIQQALGRVKHYLETRYKNLKVHLKVDICKLFIVSPVTQIKVEVNAVSRGTLTPPQNIPLCEQAQMEFDRFMIIRTVPYGQTFGGKICAALDRQHPRDIFDVKYLLQEGITSEVKIGLMLALLSGPRPIHELLMPNLQNHSHTLINQFRGMTKIAFTYQEYELIRMQLIEAVSQLLTEEDRHLLMTFKDGKPEWQSYDLSTFPAVQWKLKNIVNLKNANPEKHQKQYLSLIKKLSISMKMR